MIFMKMNLYLALFGILLFGNFSSNKSHRLFSRNLGKNNCIFNNCVTPSKVITDFLTKTEKIKNILIHPEPDDKEDWESGEVAWNPKNSTDYNGKNKSDDTRIMVGDIPVNLITNYDLAMLFI